MSADDQVFLDLLSSVPNDIRRYSNDVADYVDKHVDKVADVLRGALSSSEWIPEAARPRPPPPPPRAFVPSRSSASMLSRIHDWVLENKVLAAVAVVAVSGISYHIVRRKSHRKKRRAKRASNGARLEVVVIAGSPSEPITRSISLDLERRGFIVYITCNSIEEEFLVQNESRPDIKPLLIDIVDPSSARAAVERFTIHLQTPHAAFQGARSHHLILRSFIIIPSPSYPTSPIATLSPTLLSDTINTRLFNPILTLQSFLPLLTSQPQSHQKPSVLLLTPSIIPSLSPAFHAPESAIVAALTSFSQVLAAELAPLTLPVTHLQLGSFDFTTFAPRNQLQTIQSQRAETLKWDDGARHAYGKNFVTLSTGAVSIARKGSSLRELNDAVFDAIVSRRRGGTIRVGMGSQLYAFVGNWMPRSLVGYMMGMRRATLNGFEDEFGRLFGSSDIGSGDDASRSTSPNAGNVNRSAYGGLGDSEYVDVFGYPERTYRTQQQDRL